MPGVGARVLEKTLAHLSGTLEQAEQAHRSALGMAPVQLVDARVKLISAVILTIVAVSSHRLEIIIGLLISLASLALMARISWKRLASTWASGLFFAAVVAVPAIFTSGWGIALLLISRSETSLTCWLLLVMTTPFNRVLRALRSLGIPVVFVAILAMTFRYIFVLVETAQDMLFSRRSRVVGHLSGADKRRLLVSTTGVLLSKSIQMSDDVYHAMASRGFRGDIQILDEFRMRTTDWLVLVSVIVISGAALWAGR